MSPETYANIARFTIQTKPNVGDLSVFAPASLPPITGENPNFNGLSREEFRQNLLSPPAQKELRKILVYDPLFDERDYEKFWALSLLKQQRLEAYTKRQMETYIGERVNVISSTTHCDIVDGKIIPQGLNEPMEGIIQRGIEYRMKHGNPVDFEREDAELVGFRKIQTRLTNPETPIGAMSLSISPPGEEGSDYKRSFFDMYVLKKNESGARYIEITRFLSSLDATGYQDKLALYKVLNTSQTATDFLSNPIAVGKLFESPQELQEYLNGDIKALGVEDLVTINKILAPTILSYVDSLRHEPYNYRMHRLIFNAILNKADIVFNAIRSNDQELIKNLYHASAFAPQALIRHENEILGTQRVREAVVPCPGSSGGFDVSDPFSVSAFGFSPDQFGSRTFECPECHKTNIRPKDQLLSECQHCGSKKVCAPTSGNEVAKKAA